MTNETKRTEQPRNDDGTFGESHGGAGLLRLVQDSKPWPPEAFQEWAEAQHELNTPAGRRSIKNATAAQLVVIVNHYFAGWQAARARGDEGAAGAMLKTYSWLVGHLMRGIRDLDESDKAPEVSAAQVLDSLKGGGNEQR
jgi:hypothetical protein